PKARTLWISDPPLVPEGQFRSPRIPRLDADGDSGRNFALARFRAAAPGDGGRADLLYLQCLVCVGAPAPLEVPVRKLRRSDRPEAYRRDAPRAVLAVEPAGSEQLAEPARRHRRPCLRAPDGQRWHARRNTRAHPRRRKSDAEEFEGSVERSCDASFARGQSLRWRRFFGSQASLSRRSGRTPAQVEFRSEAGLCPPRVHSRRGY